MEPTVILRDPKKGRGVYAQIEIPKDSVIEICQLLFVDLKNVPHELEGYVYEYKKNVAAVALGNGSLYNHSNKANASFSFDRKKQLLIITAKRKIHVGEEITINYRYSLAMKRKFGIS